MTQACMHRERAAADIDHDLGVAKALADHIAGLERDVGI